MNPIEQFAVGLLSGVCLGLICGAMIGYWIKEEGVKRGNK